MPDQWTVFGGWATPPGILSDVFGINSKFIDINLHFDEIIKCNLLQEDWKQHLITELFQNQSEPLYLGGWSTGAIVALALAPILKPHALVLISPTMSFCRYGNFLHGTRPTVLKRMRAELDHQKKNVLNQFFSRCEMSQVPDSEFYSTPTLKNGLFFLEQVHLPEETQVTCLVLHFHGTQDQIIPIEAGRDVCKFIGGSMYEFEGPHAFFQKYSLDIKSVIANTIRGTNGFL